jgi:hypothetical protein
MKSSTISNATDLSSVALDASSSGVSSPSPTSKSSTPPQILKPSDISLNRTVETSPDAQLISSTDTNAKNKSNPEAIFKNDQAIDGDSSTQSNETSANSDNAFDTSVVGRKIPISESILSDCKKAIELRGDGTPCARFMPFLEHMTQEPRDRQWASSMEALLRDFILTDPAELTIRSLECRQTLCAAELVSNNGRLDNGARWVKNEALEKSLYPDTGYIGYEPDPSGNGAIYGTKVYVTVEIFERRNKEKEQNKLRP